MFKEGSMRVDYLEMTFAVFLISTAFSATILYNYYIIVIVHYMIYNLNLSVNKHSQAMHYCMDHKGTNTKIFV